MPPYDPPSKPTPEQLITSLIRHGWKQRDIAREVKCTQPTISRIYSGKHKNPGYQVVEGLRNLEAQLHQFRKVKP